MCVFVYIVIVIIIIIAFSHQDGVWYGARLHEEFNEVLQLSTKPLVISANLLMKKTMGKREALL